MNNIQALPEFKNTTSTHHPPAPTKPNSVLIQKMKQIGNCRFYIKNRKLEKELKKLSAVELSNLLHSCFSDILQEGFTRDPLKFLHRLSAIIPFETLQESVKDDMGDALKQAKSLFDDAKFYFKTTKHSTPSIRAHLSKLLDALSKGVDGLINSFGIGQLFEAPENEAQTDKRSAKVLMLIGLAGTLAASMSFLGGAARLVIGGILLTISALSIIWPYIKPMPTYLPVNAENWTMEVQREGFLTNEVRVATLNRMADILNTNRHPMLVGPSRVGKTLVAKAFAQAIAEGKYPQLKGKSVFYVNTTDLLSRGNIFNGGEASLVKKLSNAMGRHRKNIILVLDEIHMACKNQEKVADLLKPYLDEGGSFPYVIGITTEKEYSEHVASNEAFSLRFDRVNIENTDEDQTLTILSNTLLTSNPRPRANMDTLKHLYRVSMKNNANAPQPAAAVNLLKQCINLIAQSKRSLSEIKLGELDSRKISLRSQAVATNDRSSKTKQELDTLEKEAAILRERVEKERKDIDQLFKAKNLLNRVTNKTYSTVLKISKIVQGKLRGKDKRNLNRYILLDSFMRTQLEEFIKTKSTQFGLEVEIDESLVDKVAGA